MHISITCLHNLTNSQEDFDKMLNAIGRSPEGKPGVDLVEEELKIIDKIHGML